MDSHIILQEKFWNFIDRDKSGTLNKIEFLNAASALDEGVIYGVPWLVYASLGTRHLTQFSAKYQDDSKINALFSVLPIDTPILPFSEESWQRWVMKMESTFTSFDLGTPNLSAISGATLFANIGVPDLPESKLYALPLATFPSSKNIKMTKHLEEEEFVMFSNAVHGITKEMFEPHVELHAIQRLPDVVHVFGDTAEKVLPIKHLGAAGEDIEDNTAVLITGMVRFPGSRTQDFVCGLQFTTISAFEGKKCDAEELARKECSPKGYKYNLEPVNYTADALGRFDFSITPGETWAFIASYEGHDLCFGGDELDDYPCAIENTTAISLHENIVTQNIYYELENIVGGEFLVFFDVTQRPVDLGLYAGACGTPYTEYLLLITPANGCGAAMSVSDKDIVGSTGSRFAKDQWPLVNPHNESSNQRYWPYAAMDYYIQLEQAPDVSALTEDKIIAEYAGASCKPPGSNIMQFFRDRNNLVQTMLLLERTYAEVRYVYHGWFCAEPSFGDISEKSLNTPFTLLRADEVCLGTDFDNNDLTKKHLIGSSNLQYSQISPQLSNEKFIAIKIVEAHYTAPNTITYCSTFEQLANDVPTKLGVRVQIQQDVSPQAMNPCHSSNEPSNECIFTVVNSTTSLVQFNSNEEEEKDPNSFRISSTGAVPNLVEPYRRKFLARIERNDGWSVTNLAVERELVTVSSKIRGGGDDPSARYQSDTKFYATAPIRGLVYTVVHDPPGGNSYASIMQGTRIDLEVGLTTTRGASIDSATSAGAGVDIGFSVEIPGLSAGSSYANMLLEFDGEGDDAKGALGFGTEQQGGAEFSGPAVAVSASTDNGWDFHFTLDRTISSSEEAGLPGRAGDTILGGGFEIVYVRVDTVDIRNNCLKVVEEVQWLPRKPTTYIVSIFHIEYKLLPELNDLVATANDKDSIMTDGEFGDKSNNQIKEIWMHRLQQSIEDWKKTIEWSSPDFNPEGFLALTTAQQKTAMNGIEERYDKTAVPFSSDLSVFGRLMKPQIDDAYGAFSGDSMRSDYTADQDWRDLSSVWKSIPSSGIKASLNGISSGSVDVDEIIEGKGNSANQGNNDRWFPNKESFLESWQMSGTEVGKNVFTSVENDNDAVPDSLFSRGMSDGAEADMRERGNMTLEEAFFDKDNVAQYVDASIFGSKAPFSFHGGNALDSRMNPSSSGPEENIYLTFSGGGHALEFRSDVSSNIDGWSYSWSIEAEGGKDDSYDSSYSISVATASFSTSKGNGKSVALEHVMAWGKYGDLQVSYTLGDEDPYDKFVVQVSTDVRFGTPIFKTIGGASKCPGEPNTMWRESGMIIETAWSAGVNNKFIPPGERALFDLVITNESPYREGHSYGLLLTSGSSYTGDFGGNMMDLSFTLNGAATLAPFQSLVPLQNIPSVDSDGKLKHTRLSLNVLKGQFSQSYSSIGVQLVSECEWGLSDYLYRSPISSTAYLGDFKWERECPKVNWDLTTYNTYLNAVISKETSPYVNITLMNPDPLNLWSSDFVEGNLQKTNHLVHPNVEFVRVQWRKLGKGEWINAWDMISDDVDIWKREVEDADVQCKSARGEGCGFKWNLERQYFLNGLKDGDWEVRAKVFCSGYDSFASSDVKGSVTEENLNLVVDVSPPVLTSVSVYRSVVTIDYSEPVVCPQLKSDHMTYAVKRVKTCDGIAVENDAVISPTSVFFNYKFKCLPGDRGSIMVQWPHDAEAGVYILTVNADLRGSMITDAGNNAAKKEDVVAKIGCNDDEDDAENVVVLGKKTEKRVYDKSKNAPHLGAVKGNTPAIRFFNIKNLKEIFLISNNSKTLQLCTIFGSMILISAGFFVYYRERQFLRRRNNDGGVDSFDDESSSLLSENIRSSSKNERATMMMEREYGSVI